jgi:gas vesicle protein
MRVASYVFIGAALVVGAAVAFISAPQSGAAGRGAHLATPPDVAGLQRIKAKGAVTQQVIDGRLSLLEGAAWFKYLNEAMPEARSDIAPEDAGLPEGECYCRQVIRWVGTMAEQTSSDQTQNVARRLQSELDARLRRDGTVTLPAAP